jgi:Zn-dependent peptidase ImmA (M78 family)
VDTDRKPDYKRAVELANQVLTENGVTEPPVLVEELARDRGLTISMASFAAHPEVAGLINLAQRKIFVNRLDGPKRQAFTIAHELGHYVMHRETLKGNPDMGIVYRKAIDAEKDPFEQEANAFAANLLVPMRFLNRYRGLPVPQLSILFGVSEDVIRYRLSAPY